MQEKLEMKCCLEMLSQVVNQILYKYNFAGGKKIEEMNKEKVIICTARVLFAVINNSINRRYILV